MSRKPITFVTALLLLFTLKTNAQLAGYWLNTSSGTYTPLTGETVVSSSTPWDSSMVFHIPIGFSFMVGTTATDSVFLQKGSVFCTDKLTTPIPNGFQLLNAAMADRGSGSSNSPISYTLTGTAGSRIFKLQIKNAGFMQELIHYSTLSDYVNMQLWLYEGSNTAEIHFGSSQVTHEHDYFTYSMGNPIVGYSKRKGISGDGTIYTANGFPASAEMSDSVVFVSDSVAYLGQGLLGFPPNGTIYRFDLAKTHVKQVSVNEAYIFPTLCKSEIIVSYKNTEATTFEVLSVKGMPTTMSGTLQKDVTHIDLSRIAAGTYILRLKNSSGSYVQKFTKL